MTRSLVLVMSVFFAYCSIAAAQEAEVPIDCSKAVAMTRTSRVNVISFGVLNAKATLLPKPNYPATARAVGAQGRVIISIVIDPRGCVNEAKSNYGHPLLIAPAMNAALASQFKPMVLSGEAIWITGIINYNFKGDQLNWLEIGFHAERSADPSGLPKEFESQRQQLLNIQKNGFDLTGKTTTQVVDDIDVQLAAERKDQWLFRVGRLLARIDRNEFWGLNGIELRRESLEYLVNTAPTNVSPILMQHLRSLGERTETYLNIDKIKLRMYELGR